MTTGLVLKQIEDPPDEAYILYSYDTETSTTTELLWTDDLGDGIDFANTLDDEYEAELIVDLTTTGDDAIGQND